MKRLNSLACVLALALSAAPATAAPLPGTATALEQVPADAPMVIHLRGIEGVKGRFLTFIENALPEQAPAARKALDDLIKEGLEGRKLAGLKKDGPVFAVFTEMPGPTPQPKMAFVWAVDDYKAFRDGILTEEERKGLTADGGIEKTTLHDEPVFFVERKGFAVMTPSKEVAQLYTKKWKGLDGKISKTQASKLLESDLGLYLSMDVFNKQYAEQIKQARKEVEEGLKNLEEGIGKAEKNFLQLAKNAVGPVFQAVEDSRGLLVTVEFRPEGVAFHAETEVRPGSATAKLLADFKPTAFKSLGDLPAEHTYYIGMQTSKEMFRALGPLMFGALPEPDSAEAKAATEAVKQMAAAGPGVRVEAVDLPPRGLQVWQFADPGKAVAAQLHLLKSLKAGSTIQTAVLKKAPDVKEGAEKYAGFTFHHVTLSWDLEKMAAQSSGGAPLPEETRKQLADAMKKVMGEESRVWFGSNGKTYLQVTARDWEAAKKVIDSRGKGGVAATKAFQKARKEMPAEATVLALVDVVRYLGAVSEVIKPLLGGVLPLPPGVPAVEKAQPSYVGASATLQRRGGSFDAVITASAVQEFYKAVVKPLMGGAGA
jgi:hypothetical protein